VLKKCCINKKENQNFKRKVGMKTITKEKEKGKAFAFPFILHLICDVANSRREIVVRVEQSRIDLLILREQSAKLTTMQRGDLPGASQELASQRTTGLVRLEEAIDRSAHVANVAARWETENPLSEVGSVDVGCGGEADAVVFDRDACGALTDRLIGKQDDHGATNGLIVAVENAQNSCNLIGGHVIGELV